MMNRHHPHPNSSSSKGLGSTRTAKGGSFSVVMAWATQHPWRFKGLLLAFGLMVVGILALLTPQTFQSFDERSDNWTWNLKTSGLFGGLGAPERRLVVVDIDEKSVQALGAWPWPRQTLADLVGALNEEHAGLKLYDIVLPESKAGDDALQRALRVGSPNVGGQIFSVDPRITVRSGVLAGQEGQGPCLASAQTGYGFIGNAPDLAPYFAQVGHLTPVIDPDGAVRRVPAMVCFEGKNYPALSLAALRQMGQIGQMGQMGQLSSEAASLPTRGLEGPMVADSTQLVKGQSWLDAPWAIQIKSWPGFSLPLNELGQIRVSYRTPRSQFVSLSASDVMAHRVPKDLLNGAWVLVGSTAFGSGDAIPTPHGGAEGGLEVHAQLISAALDQATPYTPIGSWIVQAGVVVLGLMALLGLSVLPNRVVPSGEDPLSVGVEQWHQRERFVFALPLAGAVALVGAFGLHAWGLLVLNCWVGWSLSAASLVSGALMLSAGDLMVLRWQRTRLFENLARYMTAPVAQEVALQEASASIEAQHEQVVVLSLNVRNFERYGDSQAVAVTAEFLNAHLNTVTQAVKRHGGEVHHVQGAQVLALWRLKNNTSPREQHQVAKRALGLAQELWTQSQAWVETQGAGDLELEMGLESGQALLGSMGSVDRRFHAVMGEPVWVAQALQGMVADLSYPLLMGPKIISHLMRNPVEDFDGSVGSLDFGSQKMRENGAFMPTIEGPDAMDATRQAVNLHPNLTQQGLGDGATQESSIEDRFNQSSFEGVRLGEFLLPGTVEPRVVYACALDVSARRLHVVGSSEFEQRVA